MRTFICLAVALLHMIVHSILVGLYLTAGWAYEFICLIFVVLESRHWLLNNRLEDAGVSIFDDCHQKV